MGEPWPRISTHDGTSMSVHFESSKPTSWNPAGRRAGSPTHLKRHTPLSVILYGVTGSRARVSAAASSASGMAYVAAAMRLEEFTRVFSQSFSPRAAAHAMAAATIANAAQTPPVVLKCFCFMP